MKAIATAVGLAVALVSLSAGAVTPEFLRVSSPALGKFCTEGVKPTHVKILSQAAGAERGPDAAQDPLMVKAVNQFLSPQQKSKMTGPASRSMVATPSGNFINFYTCEAHWCPQESMQLLINPKTHAAYGVIYEENQSDPHLATHQFFGHPDRAMKGYLKGLVCEDYDVSQK